MEVLHTVGFYRLFAAIMLLLLIFFSISLLINKKHK